jgi:mRNA-degrading endonuclease RelE of RelBE toxin-antitoxin system
VSAATQICHAKFDEVFLKLPPPIRTPVQAEIDRVGLRLSTYPHHRLKGSTRFGARIGDYRIIYTFEVERNTIHRPLLALRIVTNRRRRTSSGCVTQ